MAVTTIPTLTEIEAMLNKLGLTLSISGQTLRLLKDGTVLSSITLPSGGSDIDLGAIKEDIIPSSNMQYDLGSSSYKWQYIYATYIYANYIYHNNSSYPFLYKNAGSNSSNGDGYLDIYGGGNKVLKICRGRTYINANEAVNYQISFPSSFTYAPAVVISGQTSDTTDQRELLIQICNVTKSSFNFSFDFTNNSIKMNYLNWVAVGY